MKSGLKIVVGTLALLLGLTSVWVIGGFSYLVSVYEQTPQATVASPQISDPLSSSDHIEVKNTSASEQKPRFEDYTVGEVYKGKIASLKFLENDLGYKAPLQSAIDNQEVEFAGHYIVTNWSCGMWCSVNAFIDAKTGKVFWPPISTEVCLPHLDNEFVCDETLQISNTKLTVS